MLNALANLSFVQKIVVKLLGVKVSADGLVWTAPRKHQTLVEEAFKGAAVEFWKGGTEVKMSSTDAGITLDRGDGVFMELRWTS